MINDLRPPLVTEVDRKWALDQCPAWATLDPPDDGEPDEIIDETDEERREREKRKAKISFSWSWFVDDQIAGFERFFSDQRKTYGDWSRLWRRSWWPKADPRKRMPKAAVKLIPYDPPTIVRRGETGFQFALKLCTEAERRVCEKIGVVLFKREDPRSKALTDHIGSSAEIADRVTGERAEA